MQDKSFQQALQDLQDRIGSDFQESIVQMLLQRTRAAHATEGIKDEEERTMATNVLITSQIISLLALMRDMQILDDAQYDEFTSYLLHSLASASHGGFSEV